MKYIPLSRGMKAIVDDEDYERFASFKWYAATSEGRLFYAARHSPRNHYARYTILMHREILGLSREDKRKGDHRDGNTLDNRRHNLRIADNIQNAQNSSIQSNNTSGLKGVDWVRKAGKWRAKIYVAGKSKHLGLFTDKEAAGEAYRKAALSYYGEFARIQ